MYTYLSQLVDFGDTGLENFAAFAKLLFQRLKKTPKENVDLTGIILAGFDIKLRTTAGTDGEPEKLVLGPITVESGATNPEQVDYLQEIIERLNMIFGEVTPLKDQISFVNHIASITKENDVVMAQIENNTRENVFKGNLPGAVEGSVVRALSSHTTLAKQVLKTDKQAMTALANMIYELLLNNRIIEVDE